MAVTVGPASRIASEFMPTLNEGSLLYMPVSLIVMLSVAFALVGGMVSSTLLTPGVMPNWYALARISAPRSPCESRSLTADCRRNETRSLRLTADYRSHEINSR
jgi:hypothetical protein